MKKLEGKVAVITGGSSGIGLATAERFVSEEGAYVFITGRRQSELDAAVKQIGKNNNNNVTGVQGDVSNLADLDKLYAGVKEQKGRIDILFASMFSVLLLPIIRYVISTARSMICYFEFDCYFHIVEYSVILLPLGRLLHRLHKIIIFYVFCID